MTHQFTDELDPPFSSNPLYLIPFLPVQFAQAKRRPKRFFNARIRYMVRLFFPQIQMRYLLRTS